MAFTPLRTYSGQGLPVHPDLTVGTGGVAKGDICVMGTGGDAGKVIKATAINVANEYLIALNAAAAGAKVAVCRITPDVIFATTAATGTPALLTQVACAVAGMNLLNATAITVQTTLYASIVGTYTDSGTGTAMYEVVLYPPADVA